MSDDAQDWEPAKAARVYLRNVQTGELGWLVRRGGEPHVKLDRANQDIVRKYVKSEWQAEEAQRPLAAIHAARVAFEADKALCREIGLPAHAKRDWHALRDGERQMFCGKGPKEPAIRVQLFNAIMGAMSNHVRGNGAG